MQWIKSGYNDNNCNAAVFILIFKICVIYNENTQQTISDETLEIKLDI